jgi:hypothetical protein
MSEQKMEHVNPTGDLDECAIEVEALRNVE